MKCKIAYLCFFLITTSGAAQTVNDQSLLVERLLPLSSLELPTNMAFIGPTDVLVNEKNSGRVLRVTDGVLQASPVLDLPVNSSSERGLLGMALDPQFSQNNLVYLFYTAAAIDGGTPIANRVSRFTWTGSVLQNEQLVIDLPATPGPNHDGGIIAFGPPNAAPADQKIFIIIGDLNRNNQTENFAGGAAPDNTAVVVRLNPDGSTPTGAERGPFHDVANGNTSLQTMYAYGIRNSYGMDFDPVTSALWDTENGPSNNDEINRIDAAFNSGWEQVMGPVATPPATLVQFGGVGTYSNPEFTWQAVVAPTAIHFYRGTNLGSHYQYDAFVGCNNNGKLYRFDLDTARTGFELTGNLADGVLNIGDSDAPIVFGQDFGAVTDLLTGPDNDLYVLSLTHGTIYRIHSTTTAVNEWGLYN